MVRTSLKVGVVLLAVALLWRFRANRAASKRASEEERSLVSPAN